METLRILSWNIQWGRGRDGVVSLERIAATVRSHQPDLLCLQEVARNHPDLPGGAAGDQVAGLAALLPGFEPIYGVGSDLGDGRGGRRQFGNLILSRHPVRQAFRHLLPWPPDPAVPSMQRVAVEAVVDASFGSLRVTTTHLEFYSARQRAAQVEALRDLHVQAHAHDRRPRSQSELDPPFAVLPRGEYAVLCGDFNCPAGAAELRRLSAPLDGAAPALVDAWTLVHPGQPHAPTAGLMPVPWLVGPDCYDFCFVSANLAPWLRNLTADAAADGSDHQPLILELATP